MLYYVLGCSPPLTPTFVPSHQCTLLTLFAFILPPFKVPTLVHSHQGVARVVRGARGVRGSEVGAMEQAEVAGSDGEQGICYTMC